MQDNKKRNRRSNNREKTEDVLPSSQILEKFEDAVPHSVEDLIAMAKVEQEHRHLWQTNFSKSHDVTYRLGQVFGLTYNLGLLYVVYDLITSGKEDLGITLFTINALVIGFAILATTVERKVFSRRPAKNPRNNRRSSRKTSSSNRNRSRKEGSQTKR